MGFHARHKRRQINQLVLLALLTAGLISCSDKEPAAINNNEIKASVVKAPGDTLKIVATGDHTNFGCSIIEGSVIQATNEDNKASFSISLLTQPLSCISAVGDYTFLCKFYKDKLNPSAAVYSNYGAGGASKSLITFTRVETKYMEGSFRVTCQCEFQTNCVYGKDSVVVTGTFKADYF